MIHLSAFADEIAADPAEQLDVLARNGVRNIEFRSIHKTNVLDLDRPRHESFRAMLRDQGVGLSAIGSPIGKAPIGDSFDAHRERYKIALDLAEFYETARIRVFSFFIPAGDDPAQHRDEVIRRMAKMAEMARERGLVLVLENEKGIYGDTADRVNDVLESVDSPALVHAFDPANYLEVGQSIDDAWELLRDRVGHFHVKDYDVQLHKNVPAGQGQGQIPQLIADAVSRGFQGFCVLEPHLVVAEASYGYTGPERFAEAAAALKNALDAQGIAYA